VFLDLSIDLRPVHHRTDHVYKIIYSRSQRLFLNACKPLM
jgi:hypothetical protein